MTEPVADPQAAAPGSVLLGREEQQEGFRQILSFLLIGILAIEVLFAVTATWLPALIGAPNVSLDTFREVMTIIFSPTVALVASATGFYFGERSMAVVQQRAPPQRRGAPKLKR